MSIDVKSVLTNVLHKSEESPQSILISGRTGIGKTSVVREWIKEHPEIKAEYFFANTNPRTFNKVCEPDGSLTELDFELYFATDELDSFNEKGTVLFIDNFDLTHDDARKHLLNLVEKREAVYNLDGEIKRLDNLQMIIAVAFEIGSKYFGYNPLTDEDLKSFDYVVRME